MTVRSTLRRLTTVAATGLLLLAAGCSSDSPSEPRREPGTPPGQGGGGVSYNVSVTLDPPTAQPGSSNPVLVTVRAVRSDNGAAAPTGTVVTLSAVSGAFDTQAGGSSIQAQMTNGVVAVNYFPALEAEGSVTIRANVAGSVGQAVLELDQPATFLITGVEPNFGSPQGGETVNVRGNGFEQPVRVAFGGVNARVLSAGPNSIRVETPPSPQAPNERATVAVSVTINVNEAESATDILDSAFTYSPGGVPTDQPAVFSVSPTTGPNEGGTNVSIVGEGFQAPVQVEFGAEGTFLEAQVLSVTNNRIEVLTPAATGFGDGLRNEQVDIRVRNLNSGLTAVLTGAFRYGTEVRITSISPGVGPYLGGQIVTIFGQGFDAPVAVEVEGVAAQSVVSVTGTEIVIRTTPITTTTCADVSGAMSMVNIENGLGASGPDYTYRVTPFAPLIFTVTPNSGTQAGNTLVTIGGENLLDPLVEFGGRPAAVTSAAADGSELQVRTPFFPDESLATEACDDNGDGTQGVRFVPTAVDVTVTNRATTCSFTFTDAFEYTPTDSSCRNDVGPDEPDPECSDGVDNDLDGDTDFPDDAECTDADDNDESA